MDFRNFKNKWDEIADMSRAREPAEQIVADLYVNVPAECGEMRSSILLGSDILGVRLHFKEMPDSLEKERPVLHLTCPYCVYQQDNPGWHKLIIAGYSEGKEPVTHELLWHERNLNSRSGLLAKIKDMSKQLVGMPEY